jgi:hypothetical protein
MPNVTVARVKRREGKIFIYLSLLLN